MRFKATFLVVIIGIISSTAVAVPIYTGSLSSDTGGILGVGEWVTPGVTTIAWEVTLNPATTHYKYTLSFPQKDLSHFALEVSPGFLATDILNESGPFLDMVIGLNTPAQGSPNMPEAVYSIKFDDMSGLDVILEFDSTRRPVWGDFYAKDGITTEAWNAGFTASDTDPLDPPASGSIDNHILVPDTIPEPATLSLLALGGLALLRRRRK